MRRLQPEKPGDPTYRQIWRVVDGAVRQALEAHPEYLAAGARQRTVRNSIVKRVVGAIHGYAGQSAWVRSGSSPADERAGVFSGAPAGGAWNAPASASLSRADQTGEASHLAGRPGDGELPSRC